MMNQMDRSRIVVALVLILVGVWFLLAQFVPALAMFTINDRTWPLIIVGVGATIGLAGLATWTPGLLVPACIVGGIGGLLYYQNLTGDWKSWAYAWTLIPGFVGVGVFFSSLLSGRLREAISGGAWLVFISAVMFLIFGAFLGGPNLLGVYWPVLVILLGVILLAQSFFRRT
ncbi:MAG: hypothetical protein KGJ80_02970 [Chloroflexota bacterium]|nr:hypothetical protein [Chloroflexota bacterium]